MKNFYFFLMLAMSVYLPACSPNAFISKSAKSLIYENDIKHAHTGICIYDVSSGKYLYNYQSGKYFIPASNVKLFTLFGGLKYLGDSLKGIRFRETSDSFIIYPTADPTLLHPDFKRQPLIERLQQTNKKIAVVNSHWQSQPFGFGWSWDDYSSSYMAERSALPVYGNLINWIQVIQKNQNPQSGDSLETYIYSEPDINWKVRFLEDNPNKSFSVDRRQYDNYFEIRQGLEKRREQSIPFVTNGIASALELLRDTINKEIVEIAGKEEENPNQIFSQPSDSLFRIMMHRSDNFFAEQVLLMSANEKLGVMNEHKMIDSLLKSDLKDLPQTPRWVDGSGLSRYNLFTPADFVWLLAKMKDDFGLDRLKAILPTGNTGTLAGYYTQDSGFIYAKTGTLTANLALSGYLITSKNKLLIFSIMVNNHQGSATKIRRTIEQFLVGLRKK